MQDAILVHFVRLRGRAWILEAITNPRGAGDSILPHLFPQSLQNARVDAERRIPCVRRSPRPHSRRGDRISAKVSHREIRNVSHMCLPPPTKPPPSRSQHTLAASSAVLFRNEKKNGKRNRSKSELKNMLFVPILIAKDRNERNGIDL